MNKVLRQFFTCQSLKWKRLRTDGACLTFERDVDDVVLPHQVSTRQEFRKFRKVRALHFPHPVAHYTVRIQAQTG